MMVAMEGLVYADLRLPSVPMPYCCYYLPSGKKPVAMPQGVSVSSLVFEA